MTDWHAFADLLARELEAAVDEHREDVARLRAQHERELEAAYRLGWARGWDLCGLLNPLAAEEAEAAGRRAGLAEGFARGVASAEQREDAA